MPNQINPRPELTEDACILEAESPNRGPHFPPLKSWPGLAVMCWIGAALVGEAGVFGWLGNSPLFASFGNGYFPMAQSKAMLLVVNGFLLVFYVCGVTRS